MDTFIYLRYYRRSKFAVAPHRAYKLSASYDLRCPVDEILIPARGKKIVPTDLQVLVPENCHGRIALPSGLTHKHFIDVGAGVVDVGVILLNVSDTDCTVRRGKNIAQLVCERIRVPEPLKLEAPAKHGYCETLKKKKSKKRRTDEVVQEERVYAGFGSTGKTNTSMSGLASQRLADALYGVVISLSLQLLIVNAYIKRLTMISVSVDYGAISFHLGMVATLLMNKVLVHRYRRCKMMMALAVEGI